VRAIGAVDWVVERLPAIVAEQSRASNGSRQQLEGDLMSRADDAEVAAIKGGDFNGVKALGRGDHRGIDSAERQVAVLGYELRDADGVAGVQRLDREAAAGEITEKANLGLSAQPGFDQVGDLGDDERGDDEGAWVGFEQLQAGGVVGVVGIDVGIEGAGVEVSAIGRSPRRGSPRSAPRRRCGRCDRRRQRCARTSASDGPSRLACDSGARVIDRRERRTSSGRYRAPNMSSRRIARTTSPSMLQ
jgi:hypothetical protein